MLYVDRKLRQEERPKGWELFICRTLIKIKVLWMIWISAFSNCALSHLNYHLRTTENSSTVSNAEQSKVHQGQNKEQR